MRPRQASYLVISAAVLVLAGCGSGATASHATITVTARPVQPAVIADTSTPPGSQFCHRLESAPDEAAYYASEVAYEARQAGGDVAAGKTMVGLWITISCPQYAYLTKSG